MQFDDREDDYDDQAEIEEPYGVVIAAEIVLTIIAVVLVMVLRHA